MRTTVEVIKCDLCGSEADCISVNYPVVFTSDQTEGRPCKPYVSQQKIDVCHKCKGKILRVTGYGAMGFNKYEIAYREGR